MGDKYSLESKLKDLKLTKRSCLLEGKSTNNVDVEIKLIEDKLKDLVCSESGNKYLGFK